MEIEMSLCYETRKHLSQIQGGGGVYGIWKEVVVASPGVCKEELRKITITAL
jgi:hypothetical protein